jgi:hypothetical protein
MLMSVVIYFLGPNATILGFDDEPSLGALILYNFLIYTLPFSLGLQWTYIDEGLLKNFNISIEHLRSLDRKACVILALTFLFF